MPRLSLAMIVKNEEDRLAHCLDSVRELVDEMVILDTGSTDRTAEIAHSFGARVHAFTWIGDFSAARNAALRHCSGDWILVLDADEAIDRLDHGIIRAALEAKDIQAYFLWIREYFRSGAFIGISGPPQRNDGRYTEGAAFSHQQGYQAVRLFRAQPEPVFQGRVHELAEQYFEQRRLSTGRLEAAVHHFGKVDAQRDAAKQREYTRLAKEEVRCHPEDPMAHYNLVQQALQVDDWQAVRDSAKAYLRLAERVPMMIYLGAAQACLHLGDPAAGLPYIEAMLAQQPGHAVALDARGEVLAKLGRLDEAQASFLAALESDPGFTLPFLHLSRLLDEGGNATGARSVLEAGLDQNPRDLALWTALVGRSAAREPGRVAGDAWDAIQALPEAGEGVWHLIVIHALLAQGEKADARLVLARGLNAFPVHPELRAISQRLES